MFSLLIYAKPQGLGSFEKMFLVTMLQSARRESTIFFLDYLWRTRVQLDLGHYFYNYTLRLNRNSTISFSALHYTFSTGILSSYFWTSSFKFYSSPFSNRVTSGCSMMNEYVYAHVRNLP